MVKKIEIVSAAIKQEIYKIITNYIFIISVIGIMLIIMSGTVFTEAISSTNYNFFQIVMMSSEKRRELLEMYHVTFEYIFMSGTQGYLWMFASVFTSAPFVMLICTARKNNNIRFEIFRVGKTEYVLAKCISAMICGGMVMALGYALFSIGIYLVLPVGNALNIVTYMKRLLEMFFYGVTRTCITYILSGFIRNKYLVLCIPFMMDYFFKMQLDRNKFIKNKMVEIMNPTSPAFLFSYKINVRNDILVFWICCFFIGIALYRIALGRRCDCGE